MSGGQTRRSLYLRTIVGAIVVAAEVLTVEMPITVAVTSAGLGDVEQAALRKKEKSSYGPDARAAASRAWMHPTPWHFLPDPPRLRHAQPPATGL